MALNKKLTVVFLIAAVLIVAAVFVVTQVIIPQNNYKTAQQLLEAGEYEEAADAFEKMGDYKDSQEQVLVAKYADGEEKLAKGKYFEAVYAFDALGEYRDAPERCLEAKTAIYDAAIALLEAGNYREAIEAIDQAGGVIGELPDVDKNKKYAEAMILLQDGKYEKAQEAFSALGDFRNSADMEKEASNEIAYINAKKLLEEENYTDALSVFRYLESFKDSAKYVEQICGVLYDKALEEYLASKPVYLEQTLAALEKLPSDFRDVEKYKKEISSLIHKYDGHYYRYVGSEYLDSCEFTFNGEEYHFYYTWGVNTYNYDKYNMKIKWAVENGKIVYGSAYTYTDKLIFTPTAGGMKVTSDDDSRYAGFYSKKN